MPCVYCRFPFGLILEGKDWWDYISHWSLLPSKTSSAWLQIPAGPWYCPQWPFQPLWRQEPAEINFARTMNNQYSYIVDICYEPFLRRMFEGSCSKGLRMTNINQLGTFIVKQIKFSLKKFCDCSYGWVVALRSEKRHHHVLFNVDKVGQIIINHSIVWFEVFAKKTQNQTVRRVLCRWNEYDFLTSFGGLSNSKPGAISSDSWGQVVM